MSWSTGAVAVGVGDSDAASAAHMFVRATKMKNTNARNIRGLKARVRFSASGNKVAFQLAASPSCLASPDGAADPPTIGGGSLIRVTVTSFVGLIEVRSMREIMLIQTK